MSGGFALEFECTERTDDGELLTFESTAWIAHDDGCGYYDVECDEDCPYCGETHWAQHTTDTLIEADPRIQ